MTMFARNLSVARYRSFDSYRLDLDEGVTVLAGPNAAGKTNLIEALQLLTSGASFRHPTATELVHDGTGSCRLELRLEGDGRVLDMGCGWGAMTVMTLARFPALDVTMADVNERALDLAVRNVQKNGMQAKAVLSDGFERVEGEFDAVMTNPPIRAGKAVIYRMFEDAKAHLAEGGRLFLVIRKQQGAPSALKFLKELYAEAETIERDGGYWVIACRK